MGQEAVDLDCLLEKSLAELSLGPENWSESEFQSNDLNF